MSILNDIKSMLGVENEDNDQDIMLIVNSVIMILSQLGVGPESGFLLVDETQTWEYLLEDRIDTEAIKTYMYLKTRLLFDPPINPLVTAAIETQIAQFEQSLRDQLVDEVAINSILTSIKKMLGVEEIYTHFDMDIMININSVLMFLNQLGIGPAQPFVITGKTETWSDLLGTNTNLEATKTYVYLKVRLLFDPPTSAFVLDSIDRQITMFEWRLTAQSEPPIEEQVEEEED